MIRSTEVPAFKEVNVMDSPFLREHPEKEHARSGLHAPSPASQTMLYPDCSSKERDEGHGHGLSYSPTKTGETTRKDKSPSEPSNVSRSPGTFIGSTTAKVKGQGSIVVIVPHYGTLPSPSETAHAELSARVKHLEAEHLSFAARLKEKERACGQRERACGTLLATL